MSQREMLLKHMRDLKQQQVEIHLSRERLIETYLEFRQAKLQGLDVSTCRGIRLPQESELRETSRASYKQQHPDSLKAKGKLDASKSSTKPTFRELYEKTLTEMRSNQQSFKWNDLSSVRAGKDRETESALNAGSPAEEAKETSTSSNGNTKPSGSRS